MFGSIALMLAAASPVFTAKPCPTIELAKARCGTVTVPEDRAKPNGRQIGLNIVIIPAARPEPQPQALFDLEGGPGLADSKNAGFYLTDGTAYSSTRDVVLFDQRGTGGSNPLDCPEFDEADGALRPMYPDAAVRSCRERLSKAADLTRYTTDDAVANLEAVQDALGYPKIDISALSYGTTLALRYIAERGDRVRSAVLLSAVPPSAMPPQHHAEAAQKALDRLIEDCRLDSPCNAAFPNIPSDLSKAVSKLRGGGRVSPAVAMERLRTKLYSADGARQIPFIVRRLADGDTAILQSSNARAGFNYYEGVYLTITCSESLPWFDQTEAMKIGRRTMFGNYRLDRQRAACANWPRAHVSKDFFNPIRSSVPVLFVSGGRDPVTPAGWASEAAKEFSRSRQIVIAWAGHIVDGLSGLDTCFDPQVQRFLETADPAAVDERCFAEMAPPPFKVEK